MNSKLKYILLISVYVFLGLWILYTFFRPENGGEIVFSIGAGTKEVRYVKKLIEEFERENPSIKVKVNVISSPTDQQHHYYLTRLGAKTDDIDVMRIDTIWIAEFASANWLEPLDGYLGSEERKTFIPITEMINVYGGKLYAVPWNINVGLLYYRKDILEKYHIELPVTWQSFLRACEKIVQEEEIYGFLWQGKQYEGLVCNFIEFIGGNNGRIIDNDGNVVVDSEQNAKALKLMYDLIWTYRFSPPNTYSELMEESSRHIFQQGKGLFLRNWTYVWDLCQDDLNMRDKVGVTQLPRFSHGKSAAVCGGWHLAINAYSKKKKEAWQLVEFLTSRKVQKKLALHLSWSPTRKSLYHDSALLQKLPFLPIVERSITNIQIRPTVPYYQWISEVLQKHINKVLSNQSNYRIALQDIQKKIEGIKDEFAQKQ